MRGFLLFLSSLLILPNVHADDPDYRLTITIKEDEVVAGDQFEAYVEFTNSGEAVSGVQGGVCKWSEHVDIREGFVDDSAILELDTTFAAVEVFEDEDEWTFSFILEEDSYLLAREVPYRLYTAIYSVANQIVDGNEGNERCDSDSTDRISLSFCSNVGDPAVPVAVFIDGGDDDQNPIERTDDVCVSPDRPFGAFKLSDATVVYNVLTGQGTGTSEVSLVESAPGGGDALEVEGFVCSLRYFGTQVTAVGVTPIGALEDVNDGDGPDLFEVNLDPEDGPGLTVEVLFTQDLTMDTIQFDEEKALFEIEWATEDNELEGETVVPVGWYEVGDPLVYNEVTVDGDDIPTGGNTHGQVTLSGIVVPPILRGDCNDDGMVDMLDAVFALEELALGTVTNVCTEACDADDSGEYDMSDPLYVLNYRYLDGPAPPEPFPDCALHEDTELPDCEESAGCEG